MKTKLFVLGLMLLSSASSAQADTRKVNEKHLQQHRDFEKKNLEHQRFKIDSRIHFPIQTVSDRQKGSIKSKQERGALLNRGALFKPADTIMPSTWGMQNDTKRNGLPNSKLNSFILNPGGLRGAIYGDEATTGPPPHFGFGRGYRESMPEIRGLEYLDIAPPGPPSFWSDWRLINGEFNYGLPINVYRSSIIEKEGRSSVDLNIVAP